MTKMSASAKAVAKAAAKASMGKKSGSKGGMSPSLTIGIAVGAVAVVLFSVLMPKEVLEMFVVFVSGVFSSLGLDGIGAKTVPEISGGQLYNTTCRPGDLTKLVHGCSSMLLGKNCARVVFDDFASDAEIDSLKRLVDMALNISGGGSGPPSIVDMQSGALSSQNRFIAMFEAIEKTRRRLVRGDVDTLRVIKERILNKVRGVFGVDRVWLAAPLFFSRIDANKEPRSQNDIYWAPHVDRLQYGTFSFTGLLYLNNYGDDYEGGRFEFMESRMTNKGLSVSSTEVQARVIPRRGRLSLFTSGPENPHRVEKLISGRRYALTIAFTCDEESGIDATFLDKVVDSKHLADSFEHATQLYEEFVEEETERVRLLRLPGEQFIEEMSKVENVTKLEAGVLYDVIESGEGTEHPGLHDKVEIHYEGKLINGTVFDSTYKRNKTIKLGVDKVIPGWSAILPRMVVGDIWNVYIPTDLAYAERGFAGTVIEPYVALHFKIELISIEKVEVQSDAE